MKNKTKKIYLKTFLLGILVFFISALPARAFGITPVKFLLTVDPGTSQTVVVKIKNDEKINLAFKLDVSGLRQDEEGRPVFERGIDAAENWVYPENNSVSVKAGETKSVNFIIKIPANVLAGSHYLGLSVEPVLQKVGQASLNTRLVSLLTLQVKGLVNEQVAIEKWTPFADVADKKNWKFDLGLKNNGTIEVLLRGTMSIRNWKGEEIFSEPIVLGNKLLAGSRRALQPEIALKNNISLPGLYQAQMKINYGRTNQTISALAYIWYFPVWSKIVLFAFGVLLVVVLILIFRRRR